MATFGNKFINKYSNYNYYSVVKNPAFVEVDEIRLIKLIQTLLGSLKKPYLRFMWMTQEGVTDALAVLYNGDERLTKLCPLSDIETMALNASFHR